ncbi:MAG TPA: hypothetical protein VM470_03710, partial [Acidimicrobiia bacterium]|nr:hypothetical protein [Acidimicrobiia bacterium]
IGTIHGVGGEVNVVDIDRFQGQFLALGTYTEKMPISEAEPRLQLPAVWHSDDGIGWEMTRLHTSHEDTFDPWHLFAGDELALVGGWTPSNLSLIETYRSLPEELRREVGTGHLRIKTDPLGEVVLTAGPIVVHSEQGGVGLLPHSMHVHRTVDGTNWERIDQVGMGSGLVSLLSGTITSGTSTVLVQQNWPAELPDQLPQLVGNYLLGEDNEALNVFDLRGEALGSWPTDRGPVEGHLDSTTRSVTITTPEGDDFVFPVDDLATYGEFPAAPQSALAVSEDGVHWGVTDLPTSGLIDVIGPLGPGYLLQSRSQTVEGLWPAVYRYLLLVP